MHPDDILFFCVSKESTNNLFAAQVQICSCQKGHCDKKKSFIGKIFDVLFVCDANNEVKYLTNIIISIVYYLMKHTLPLFANVLLFFAFQTQNSCVISKQIVII